MSQKIYNSFSDSDGVKAMVARKLTHLELSRGEMIKCLDLCLNMNISQLEQIKNNLSKNQLKTKFGQAIVLLVEIKKTL